jgi:hypothetical protein
VPKREDKRVNPLLSLYTHITSWATTIPHIALLNLDLPETDYKVIWKWNERAGKWTVAFEEILA